MFIFGDSFQQYATGLNNPAGGLSSIYTVATPANVGISTAGGRWGTKALQIGSGGVTATLAAATPRGCFNFAITTAGAPSGAIASPWIAGLLAGTFQFSLVPNAAGGLDFKRGNGSGTVIASTPAGILFTNTWYFVELIVENDAAAGKVILYVNGIKQIDLTGLNTRGAASNNFDQWNASSSGLTTLRSDLYITDQFARIGERKFETLPIISNGATQDFVANTGAAWDAINDNGPDDDTTYISAGTVGNRSIFGLTDLSTTPAGIEMVMVRAYAKKDDAVSRAIKIGATDGSNTSLSGDKGMSTTYGHVVPHIMSLALDGGAWTKAKIDALSAVVDVSI